MADRDFNAIKPEENLPTVAGLKPTSQRQERKRRQNAPRRDRPPDEARMADDTHGQTSRDDGDGHAIDYCA